LPVRSPFVTSVTADIAVENQAMCACRIKVFALAAIAKNRLRPKLVRTNVSDPGGVARQSRFFCCSLPSRVSKSWASGPSRHKCGQRPLSASPASPRKSGQCRYARARCFRNRPPTGRKEDTCCYFGRAVRYADDEGAFHHFQGRAPAQLIGLHANPRKSINRRRSLFTPNISVTRRCCGCPATLSATVHRRRIKSPGVSPPPPPGRFPFERTMPQR